MLALTVYAKMLDGEDDHDKFRRIYEQYGKLMLYRAEQILKDSYLAEDAVHQAFLKIIPNLNKISKVKCNKTKHFLVVVVERAAIDIYRKEQRRKEMISEKNLELLAADSRDLSECVLNPVEKCIYQLPEIYKEIFVLKHCCGYSNHEISEILHVKENTIRQRMARGKELLKESLAKEGIYVE